LICASSPTTCSASRFCCREPGSSRSCRSRAALLASFLSIRHVALPSGLLQERRIELFWHRRTESDPGHAWFRELVRRSANGSST
jgi:hypothetical protein